MKASTIPTLIFKHIIAAVDDNALYQPNNDFSILAHYDIDMYRMSMIETIIRSLRAEPYLTKEELVQRGASGKFIDYRLGGIRNIKELLEIQDYNFIDFLEQENIDISKTVKLSYYHYQTFIHDIRHHFRANDDSAIPIRQLRIELSSECAINAIPLLKGKYTAAVPATDFEALLVGMGLISKDYSFIRYSDHLPILTVKPDNEEREVDIEVRCLASQFNQRTDGGICVVDDIGAMHKHPYKKHVLDFPSLLKKNGYEFED